MGASRKLQGEIDRVLKKVQEGVEVFDSIWNKVHDTENANQKEKFEADLKKEIKKLQRYRDQIKTWIQSSEIKDKKVSASYEQALLDSRKLIEREMERFKVCEKETKTKAFSKEGLGQQPKTDPKEKAKSETRDWVNNVVGDLESQIDNFEAELEGLSVKKGKTRPPRLVHLETSIARHKAHIIKIELILRLLENDELSPDQVNDVRDFLEDYIERNQDDFDEFSDVDELYSSLPLEKVEALEDQFSLGPSSLVKAALSSTAPQSGNQDEGVETSHDNSSEAIPTIPISKDGPAVSLTSTPSHVFTSAAPTGSISLTSTNASVRTIAPAPTVSSVHSIPDIRGVTESSSVVMPSSLVNTTSSIKDDDTSFPGRRPSPAIPEVVLGTGISRGASNQAPTGSSSNTTSSGGITSNITLGSVQAISDLSKRNMLNVDERIGNSGLSQPLISPLSNKVLLPQVSKNDGNGLNDGNSVAGTTVIGGRAFSPSLVTGVQWRPQSATSFQNPNENGPFRGRPEIAPDQREKFLERFQQVQQQGHSNILNMPLSGANNKQFASQQQPSLLQQFTSQSSSISPQIGLSIGVQGAGVSSITSVSQQMPSSVLQHSSQHNLIPSGIKETDAGRSKVEEFTQVNLVDSLNVERPISPSLKKIFSNDDFRTSYMTMDPVSLSDGSQWPRDAEFSPGPPLQLGQSSASVGVIGRRSAMDLGAIGDNLSGSAGTSSILQDQIFNMKMLEAAYHKLPHPSDSQPSKNYVPRYPAATPASYPQTQAPIVDNPAFWERSGLDSIGIDTLFFAFYYQPNTYQQYLAARELKKQSWRYHKKFNTWFQRHDEPKFSHDTFERGNYIYFDFHVADDGSQNGWCQRIKTDFTFEYGFLEDELVV